MRHRAEISDATYKAVVRKGRKHYILRYSIYYPDGTNIRPSKIFDTKTEAQDYYSKLCDDLARDRRRDTPVLKTIGDIADEYLATSAAHMMDSSQKIEAKIVKSILKHIDRTRQLTSFSREEHSEYIKSRAEKPTMARHECRVLRKLFAIAVEQGILLASPAEKLRSMKRIEPPIYYMSSEEVRAVLDLAKLNAEKRVTTHDYRGVMYLYSCIAFFTGARPGEIFRMRMDDFDTDMMTLTFTPERHTGCAL